MQVNSNYFNLNSMHVCIFVRLLSLDRQVANDAVEILKAIYSLDFPNVPTTNYSYREILKPIFTLIMPKTSSGADPLHFKCKICDVKVKKVFMRLHISRHFLEETSVPSLCMYCGINCNNPLKIAVTSGFGSLATYGPVETVARHIDILAWHVLQENQKTSLVLIAHFNVLFVIIFFALTLWKIIMLRVTSALTAQII
jgi:hypothetical protein